MCCTRLADIQDAKNRQKIRHGAPSHNLSCIFATKACVNNRKKTPIKQQYLLHMFPQYGELRSTNGWDWFTSLGHPNKFQRVSRLAFVTAATSLTVGQPNFHDVWPSPGLVLCICIFGGSCCLTEFCQVQNSLYVPILAFPYIGSVTARHSSSRRQPNFASWYKEWNYENFTEGATYIWLDGHHVGHRPTF